MRARSCLNRLVAGGGIVALSAGCRGMQSTLEPAGREAETIASIVFWMAGGFTLVWLAVLALALYAPRARPSEAAGKRLIVAGGVVVPLLALSALLAFGLSTLPDVLEPAPEGSMSIAVTGSQWWWRVRYLPPGGVPVDMANEIRLPLGERIDVLLTSTDVIHSFWVPAIAGKMDMIPGRQNRISLQPTRTGTFRGTCAEFCGSAHAMMSFEVVVMEPAQFEAWLAAQARPARAPATPEEVEGHRVFMDRGCNTCHTIRGTDARGVFGPDLTHVASRRTLAAGRLPSRAEDFRLWIAHTERVKPGTHMPAFSDLPEQSLVALSAYLGGLR